VGSLVSGSNGCALLTTIWFATSAERPYRPAGGDGVPLLLTARSRWQRSAGSSLRWRKPQAPPSSERNQIHHTGPRHSHRPVCTVPERNPLGPAGEVGSTRYASCAAACVSLRRLRGEPVLPYRRRTHGSVLHSDVDAQGHASLAALGREGRHPSYMSGDVKRL
jgi:hypothetical protein